MKIRIGSRGSALALAQTNGVARSLREAGHEVEVRVIETAGDRDASDRFADIGAPGVFVRDIEAALLAGEVDLAVHSYKDLPSSGPAGLVVAAVPERLDAADHLVARGEAVAGDRGAGSPVDTEAVTDPGVHAGPRAPTALPLIEGAVVGTSSARRIALLRALRPDLRLEPMRGNVPTRLDKLRQGPCQAVVLAAAGLQRLARDADAPPLGLEDLVDIRLDPAVFVPSPAQGAIALQCRGGDAVEAALAPLHDERAALPVRAERELLRLVEGGCNLPFGAWARLLDGDHLELIAVLETGGRLVHAHAHGASPEELAARVWQILEAGTEMTHGLDEGRP